MVDTLKLRLKDIDNFSSLEGGFNVKLKNGAECNFDENTLECKYNVKSYNPFSQPINDPDEDYRFTEQIKVENIELKPSKSEINSEVNKTFDSKFTGDTKITYVGKYPTYSDLDMERNISIANKNGESIVNIKGFFGYNEENSNIYFTDIYKGGTQAIVQYEEDSLIVENKGLGNLGSKLEVESVEQTLEGIDLEKKSGILRYDDTYQVRYYTEPYSDGHNLEINII